MMKLANETRLRASGMQIEFVKLICYEANAVKRLRFEVKLDARLNSISLLSIINSR